MQMREPNEQLSYRCDSVGYWRVTLFNVPVWDVLMDCMSKIQNGDLSFNCPNVIPWTYVVWFMNGKAIGHGLLFSQFDTFLWTSQGCCSLIKAQRTAYGGHHSVAAYETRHGTTNPPPEFLLAWTCCCSLMYWGHAGPTGWHAVSL